MSRNLTHLGIALLTLLFTLWSSTPINAQINNPAQPININPAVPPALAWTVTNNAVYILAEDSRVYRLTPATLATEGISMPLVAEELGGATAYLADDGDRLFVAVLPVTGDTATIILDATTLDEHTRLTRAGPLGIDPGRRLLLLDTPAVANETPPPDATLWTYDLTIADDQLVASATALDITGIALRVDPVHRLLAVVQRSGHVHCPSEGCQSFTFYDLDTGARLGDLADQSYAFNQPPVTAPLAGKLLVSRRGANGEAQIRTYTADGELLRTLRGIDGQVATDARNRWTYVLRPRGLWLFQGSNGAPTSVLPFRAPAPTAIQLAPDAEHLYLLGNGWLASMATSTLQTAGIGALTGSPVQWAVDPAFAAGDVRLYPVGDADAPVTFAGVGELGTVQEIYRAVDDKTWALVDAPFAFAYVALSPSPTVATDQTIVSVTDTLLRRSQDGGRTWQPWTPPRLAFTGEDSGNHDIYVLESDGKRVRQVTNAIANDELPAWSPGWTWLVFVSHRTGNADIFMINADCDAAQTDESACNLTQLTDNPGDDLLPAWSPDGRWIAFVSTRDSNPELYLMRSDGSDVRRLTDDRGGDWRPAWLADGRSLLFTSSRGGNNDLYRLMLDDAMQPTMLIQVTASPADERDPAVAPDGTVYFVTDRQGATMIASLQLSDALPIDSAGWSVFYGDGDTLTNLGHPTALLEPSRLLLSAEATDLAIFDNYGELIVNGVGFTGHPAALPTLWQPSN